MESKDNTICRELLEVRNFWTERSELEMRAADEDSDDDKLRIARLMHAAMVDDYRRILASAESAKVRLAHARTDSDKKIDRKTRARKSDKKLTKEKQSGEGYETEKYK